MRPNLEINTTFEEEKSVRESGEINRIQANMLDFVKGFEEISLNERKNFLDESVRYEENGDLASLRVMGLSLDEIEKNPSLRQKRLATLFLKRDISSSEKIRFNVDYRNNELAEWNLDITDLLPANALRINVYDQDGVLIFENAIRKYDKKSGKNHYFDKDGKKAFVQSGFQIEIADSEAQEGMKKRSLGSKACLNFNGEIQEMRVNAGVITAMGNMETKASLGQRKIIKTQNFYDRVFEGLKKFIEDDTWKAFVKTGKLDLRKADNFLNELFSQTSISKKDAVVEIDNEMTRMEENADYSDSLAPEDAMPIENEAPLVITRENNLKKHARNIVRVARVYVGSNQFRGREVAGGRLACAQVVSTILKDAGEIDSVLLSVSGVENQLLLKGWKKCKAPAKAGDVVIWGKTRPKEINGIQSPGHRHIGVMTGPTHSINNNSALRQPVERPVDFNSPRGVYLLRKEG